MKMKLSAMALAVAAVTSQMAYAVDLADSKGYDPMNPASAEGLSSQAKSNGFFEDADLSLFNRNFAFYRNFNHGESSQNYRNEWAHGFMTTFTSGFTQGIVGFGLDAFGNVGLRLNSGAGIGGTGLLPINGSNPEEGQSEYGIAGGAVKARLSETVLAFGQQRPESPVFAPGDSRLLPSYATGTSLMSEEIRNLTVQGGHFYSGSGSASTNQDGELSTVLGGTDFNTADYFGLDYAFTDTFGMGLHASQYSDLWNQYYADLYHTFKFDNGMALNTSLNYYKTKDEGDADAGNIDTNTFSGALALAVGPQTFTIAHQQVNGDTPFDYLQIDGQDGDSIWLANSVQYSDFNNPGEKSYQARYDLDLGAFGMDGLSFMIRYVKGEDSNGTKAPSNGAYANWGGKNGTEWERDVEVKYVVPSGPAKDLSFRTRWATWRSNHDYYGTTDESTGIDEVRLITEYPLDVL